MSWFKSYSNSRLIQLDVLRGVAVLLVIGHHQILQPEESGIFQPLANVFVRFGWSGVDLFFVLSGFLVGGLLLGELRTKSSLAFSRFIVRRGFKIWPSYFIYLLAVFILLLIGEHGNAHRALGHILPNFLHLQNYLGTARPHTWSLAVEEHFYILLPLLLLLLIGGKRKRSYLHLLPVIAIALVIVCTSLRYLVNAGRPYDPATHYNPTHLRIDSLFFGVLLAYLYHFRPTLLERVARYRRTLFIAGLSLVCPMMIVDIRNGWFVSVIGFTMLYFGYGLILVAMLYTTPGQGWSGKMISSIFGRSLAFVGIFSYSIYLWHIDAARLPLQALAKMGMLGGFAPSVRWLLIMIIYVTLAVATGVMLGVLIERPFLMIRDKIFPSRTNEVTRSPEIKEHDCPGGLLEPVNGLVEAG